MNAILKDDTSIEIEPELYVWPRDTVESLHEALSSPGFDGSHCYRETVPEHLRREVRYVTWQSETNSLDKHETVFEIIAVDGQQLALVQKTTVYCYEDASNSIRSITTLAEATTMLQQHQALRDASLAQDDTDQNLLTTDTPASKPAVKIASKITGYSVTQPKPSTTNEPSPTPAPVSADADRRLTLTAVPAPLANSLRWASRPHDPDGHPSRTYRIDSPEGRFTVHVVHVENGTPTTGYPFEVWVGDGAPRGMRALCKSLSMDMRSLDRGWLKMKLESLFTAPGEAFDLTLPGGRLVRADSAVSAFARIVHARCEQLGAFSDEKLASTPVVDALMSRKEPKANGVGTIAWMVPIRTPCGDDFEIAVKEVMVGDVIVPQSIWLTGRSFPKSLEGLAISLSFDLRVNDPRWSVLKLQQLVDIDDAKDEFWATVPGGQKSASYPSVAAYMAALILYRLRVIGLIDAENNPVAATNMVSYHEDTRRQQQPAQAAASIAAEPTQVIGKLCTNCKGYSVLSMGGCDTCRDCGHSSC